MIQKFENQESEYSQFLARGEVLNDFPGWRRLHRANCNMLNRAGPASYGLHTSVRKICSDDLRELKAHVARTIGREGEAYQLCFFCFRD